MMKKIIGVTILALLLVHTISVQALLFEDQYFIFKESFADFYEKVYTILRAGTFTIGNLHVDNLTANVSTIINETVTNINVTENVTAHYFIGDGSYLTGIGTPDVWVNESGDTMTGTLNSQTILPTITMFSYDLGSSSKKWRDIYTVDIYTNYIKSSFGTALLGISSTGTLFLKPAIAATSNNNPDSSTDIGTPNMHGGGFGTERFDDLYMDGIIYIDNYNTGINLTVDSTTGFIGSTSDDDLIIGSNGVGMIYVSDGDVGIGQSSPSDRLDVVTGTGTGAKGIELTHGSNTSQTWAMQIMGSANSNPNAFIIADRGSTKFLIEEGTGYVGIGTTTPDALLEILGSMGSGPQSPDVLFDKNAWLTLGHETGYGYIGWFTKGNGTDFVNTHATVTPKLIKDAGDRLSFRTSTATGSGSLSNLQERMVILNSGEVGIGLASPSTKLHVRDTMAANYLALFEAQASDVSANAIGIAIDDDAIIGHALRIQQTTDGLWKTGTPVELFEVTYDGKVGIGTTSPQSALHLNGSSGTSQQVKIETTGAGISSLALVDDTVTKVLLRSDANDIYFNHGGNVGIGTTSPDTKLHVEGDLTVGGTGIFFENSLSGGEADLYRYVQFNNNDKLSYNDTNNVYNFEFDGSANYVYFDDGMVAFSDSVTGSNNGTALCIDANNRLCACGSCA